ncbi:MAG: GNAT family N-acetyltransferase [Candidatus Eisenbacteria bacterium]|uniref:GNAT family N-acetyltransferase n=1 Tax=Eiseniibacteriota bacterium TaxID=2212470 RepID=A0A948RU50_UNCEI|nr:GNAT family N-acetyltransferase [Candidatus Eisenbacteria bacterium]MBU1950535.1 GNAT family N-acetyltransferase [Candidatus Eisenbacteria bacterium]MBU2690930.1 GNAT family N-acetyltransferase [Candidatus Eisenbacteria bacterium]
MTLETSRLFLRPMTADDIDAFLVIFTDPKVMKSFDNILFTREQMTAWVTRNLEHQKIHGYGLFSVLLKEDGVLIGDCGLECQDLDGRREIELGYDFRSDYWNQGYATEAARAVRDYAFHDLKIDRLISFIRPENPASMRVAEKIDMKREREILRGGKPYWIYAQQAG